MFRTPPLADPGRAAAVIASMLAALALAGCSRGPEPAKAAEPAQVRVPVALRAVEVRSVQREIEVVGTLWGDEDAVISAKIPGKIIAVHKDIGDTLTSSEVVAQLLTTDYLLAQKEKLMAVREALGKLGLKEMPSPDYEPVKTPTVERARLQAENARSKFDRGKKLFVQEQPRISQQEFDDLKTAWEVAQNDYDVALLVARNMLDEARTRQAELDIATQRVSDTSIKAPGPTLSPDPNVPPRPRRYEVVARMGSVGELVRELTPLYRVVDRDVVKLKAMVPERFAALVAVKQQVKVSVEAHRDEFTGTVTRINPQVDPANRMFQVEIAIDNADHRLMPGAFARARIQTKKDPRVVFVPLQSVLSFAGVNKVFTIKEGAAQEIVIEMGDRQGDWVEVTRPLTGSESVVVNGQTKLATGVAVEVK